MQVTYCHIADHGPWWVILISPTDVSLSPRISWTVKKRIFFQRLYTYICLLLSCLYRLQMSNERLMCNHCLHHCSDPLTLLFQSQTIKFKWFLTNPSHLIFLIKIFLKSKIEKKVLRCGSQRSNFFIALRFVCLLNSAEWRIRTCDD